MILDYYSHQKYFIVQGTYNGVPGTNMVLTGSSNWASLSTANDETWFTIQGAVRGEEVPEELRLRVEQKGTSTRATPTPRRTPYFRVPGPHPATPTAR